MSTIYSPVSFGQTQGDLGYDFVFAEEQIRQELMDELNVFDSGAIPLVGDLAGTGTDTVRITRMGSFGWGRRFTSLAHETDAIPTSSFTTGYTEITLGMSGMAEEETFQNQILTRERGVTLEELVKYVPMSWMATFRYDLMVLISTFSSSVGSASTYASMDDLIDLVTVWNETVGAGKLGIPPLFGDPAQYTQLAESARSEPAFQNMRQDFSDLQKRQASQHLGDIYGLGFDMWKTDDVQQSGGGYVGGAFEPGAVGWAVANTSRIQGEDANAIYVPELGLYIARVSGVATNGKARYEARTWRGMGEGHASLGPRRKFISKV